VKHSKTFSSFSENHLKASHMFWVKTREYGKYYKMRVDRMRVSDLSAFKFELTLGEMSLNWPFPKCWQRLLFECASVLELVLVQERVLSYWPRMMCLLGMLVWMWMRLGDTADAVVTTAGAGSASTLLPCGWRRRWGLSHALLLRHFCAIERR